MGGSGHLQAFNNSSAQLILLWPEFSAGWGPDIIFHNLGMLSSWRLWMLSVKGLVV
jgi:hypothetical protein